jgi:hypothetical protein
MKRTEIEVSSENRFVRRDEDGQFTQNQVDVERSLAADQRRRAKYIVPEGQGDRGDRKRPS